MPLADTLIFDPRTPLSPSSSSRRPSLIIPSVRRAGNKQDDSVDAGASGRRDSTSSISQEFSPPRNRCRRTQAGAAAAVVAGLPYSAAPLRDEPSLSATVLPICSFFFPRGTRRS